MQSHAKLLLQVAGQVLRSLEKKDCSLAEISEGLAGLWGAAVVFQVLEKHGDVMDLKNFLWNATEGLSIDLGILLKMGPERIEKLFLGEITN